jgi:diketogulonate reductase-like aldo/keto reductase
MTDFNPAHVWTKSFTLNDGCGRQAQMP